MRPSVFPAASFLRVSREEGRRVDGVKSWQGTEEVWEGQGNGCRKKTISHSALLR